MHTVTVIVTRRLESSSAPNLNKREAFWAGLALAPNIAKDADSLENKVRNLFPRFLTDLIQSALTYRIIFRFKAISYESIKIELGIPDADTVLGVLGNNVDVLETVLEAYAPEAFANATGADDNQFNFKAEASRDLVEYARARVVPLPSESRQGIRASSALEDHKEDAKQKGARIAADLIRSPLIFPVLLIVFLWYVARQDTLAERQIVSGLMQALIQQQTATTTILRDVAVKASEPSASQSSGAKSLAPAVTEQKRELVSPPARK